MPTREISSFSVSWLQVMNERGIADEKLLPTLEDHDVKAMYEFMVLSRALDEKCLFLQRQGRLGTYASVRGQEACQVGSAYALKPEDWSFPAFRETAVNLVRGVPAEGIIAYWAGDEKGQQVPKTVNAFPVSIPVATHLPHAVGCAWGMKIRKQKSAVLVTFGDGATSKGDFHEAMNWAGAFQVPIVFLCQNNQFAISLRVEQQTAAKTLAQKAVAYGFPGVQVDGNDIFAVHKATREALEQARNGGGPTFIEALTYRIEHHTTADDSWRYRTKKEVEEWKAKDPIARLELWMARQKLLTEEYRAKVADEARIRVEEAVEKVETGPKPRPEDMFDFVYEKLTPQLREQREALVTFLAGQKAEEKA